jgi:hypothetical protein
MTTTEVAKVVGTNDAIRRITYNYLITENTHERDNLNGCIAAVR